MNRTLQFTVKGRVQGVGFRYATRQAATSRGLMGWVCNKPNGDVQGLVHGDDANLSGFLQWLWSGPQYAIVTDVIVTESADTKDNEVPDNFVVIR